MTGETFLIYTTEGGGYFKGLVDGEGRIRYFSADEFANLKQVGELDITPPWDDGAPRKIVKPVLIALARIEENHDFLLGSSREKAAAAG